ncbi:hypothetical protein WMF27_45885 [Sorangium sp. So ce281]|uniref:hypothetical protein n=1 Tax=unclassified Sorangium TaxID=2621164 RepID=UPI003F61ABD3
MMQRLADGFKNRCGYSAMWTPRGTVDHDLSRSTHPERTYEWDNYRFASGEMNSRKGTWNDRVLDPFEIEDGWFEILLPSLELVMVEERIPAEQRDRARFTLKKLRLQDDDGILEQRQSWYDEFLNGEVTLSRGRLSDQAFPPALLRASVPDEPVLPCPSASMSASSATASPVPFSTPR